MARKKNPVASTDATSLPVPKPTGRPPKYDNPADMERDINKYLIDCKINEVSPVVSGLAVACGMDTETLIRYSHRPGYGVVIKKAKAYVQHALEGLLVKSRNNAGVIFIMKNQFGWADRSEILSLSLFATMSEKDIKTKILDMQGQG